MKYILAANKLTQVSRFESKLLLCCARTHIDPIIETHIKELLKEDIDWNYLIKISAYHKIMPLLYQSLNTTHSAAVPKPILSQLHNSFYENATHSLFLSKELLQLLELFKTYEIPVIPF